MDLSSREWRLCPRAAVLVPTLSLIPAAAIAQGAVPDPDPDYDPAIPRVETLRGFPSGEMFSTYSELMDVVEGLDAASDRIRLERYGTSVEGRPLVIAWVSAPANLARLDSLRAVNAAVADGGTIEIDNHPIFVWLSFGVHGDEASTPEAALELLYHLAAARDTRTSDWLDRTVIAIDPLLNPDGHERYVAWYRSVQGPRPDPDPSAREHRPPWPSGRTNHWYFDLNRDWAWGVQPETRARIDVYLATLPQVHVDFHEMEPSASYFFFPPAEPVHPFYPPSTAEWARIFGAANAAAFDGLGWAYYTTEDFDLFYPGYGDSWPSFYGATGMTYEQGGGGAAGVALSRPGSEPLLLADRIRHHVQAAVTTIETAVAHRRDRLADFIRFWEPELRIPAGGAAAYLVPRGPGAANLAELLVRQDVRVDTLSAPLATAGLTPYSTTSIASESLPPGTFLLAGHQPLGRYLAALMSPGKVLSDTILHYDITGWALPFLYDVAAYRMHGPWQNGISSGRWVPAADSGRELAAGFDSLATESAVAFLWEYATREDIFAAARLLEQGVRVQIAEEGFTTAGRRWRPGTFLVPADQPDSLSAGAAGLWRRIRAAGADPAPVASFRTEDGIDLGSDRIRTLRRPRIALVAGAPVSPTSLGAAWHLLAREVGIDAEIVSIGDLEISSEEDADSSNGEGPPPIDLSAYTAIVLPDAPDPDRYGTALGDRGRTRLAEFVAGGGTLVGVRHGAAYLTAGESGLSEVELAEEPAVDDAQRRSPEAEHERIENRDAIPGTLLAARVDSTSPLGYGYSDGRAAVMAREPVEFALAERGNAWLYADEDPLAGILSPDARERLPGSPYAVVSTQGSGNIVLFADDPAFRGIMHALAKLYLNALILLPR